MEPVWWLTKDGDCECYKLYRRHYSAKKNRRPKIRQFVGPGESIVLRTIDASALFVWRKYIDDSGQVGVNCAAFRNESGYQSSELIRQADRIADRGWPGLRHYTYVDPKELRSENPGWCFYCAGWRWVRDDAGERLRTKSGLLIMDRLPRHPGATNCVK